MNRNGAARPRSKYPSATVTRPQIAVVPCKPTLGPTISRVSDTRATVVSRGRPWRVTEPGNSVVRLDKAPPNVPRYRRGRWRVLFRIAQSINARFVDTRMLFFQKIPPRDRRLRNVYTVRIIIFPLNSARTIRSRIEHVWNVEPHRD